MRAFTEEEIRYQPQTAATHTYDLQSGRVGDRQGVAAEWRAATRRTYAQEVPIKYEQVPYGPPELATPEGGNLSPKIRQHRYGTIGSQDIARNLPNLEKSLREYGLRIAERELVTAR